MKPNSRWHPAAKVCKVPRYDKRTEDGILRQYHEPSGWRNGAKVTKRS